MSALTNAFQQAMDQSPVNAYVCAVISRSLSAQMPVNGGLDAEAGATTCDVLPPNAPDGAAVSRQIVPELNQALPAPCEDDGRFYHRQFRDSFADLQPLDWSEGQAFVAALAASQAECAAPGGASDACPTGESRRDGARAEVAQDDLAFTMKAIGRTVGAVNSGVAYVEGSLNAFAGRWDSLDCAAEMYARRLEDLVKGRAVALSCKSRCAREAMDAAAECYAQQLGEAVSRNVATLTGKAAAASQAAAAMRAKTGELVRGKVHGQVMQDGLQTARRKMATALGGKSGVARFAGSRGGA